MPFETFQKNQLVAAPDKVLREGFTTGTAAAGAAMAALQTLLAGSPPSFAIVPLPPFSPEGPAGRLPVPVLEAAIRGVNQAVALVRKDGGDDPDATRHAVIKAEVTFFPMVTANSTADSITGFDSTAVPGSPVASDFLSIMIEGGEGIGRVTLPGLPVAVGEAAINPVPRLQIEAALRETMAASGRVHVLLSVPGGEDMARHTLNSRLGIVGGISILGTHGLVKPFSHEAWKETIRQGIAVARATGCRELCLSTGRRSEKALMRHYGHLPAQAFVQAADFVEFSLSEAAKAGFESIAWGCFFGKLLKLGQGLACTHAHVAPLDLGMLAEICAAKDVSLSLAVKNCITANHALDLLLENNNGMEIIELVAALAARAASTFAGREVRIHLFHLNGAEILTK